MDNFFINDTSDLFTTAVLDDGLQRLLVEGLEQTDQAGVRRATWNDQLPYPANDWSNADTIRPSAYGVQGFYPMAEPLWPSLG